MRGEFAMRWFVCAGLALGVSAVEHLGVAPEKKQMVARQVLSSPLVPGDDWLSEYTKVRKPKVESKTVLDCFAEDRKTARPYPHDCYGLDFAFNSNAFWQFWQEIRGDLQYTFDFVLYEEFFEVGGKDKVVTSFWLLMAYLKHLAIKIPDPNDIAEGNLLAEKQKIYEKFKEELMLLNQMAQQNAAELDELVKKMSP